MLNPVFSINHMKQMTPIFYRISHKLLDGITMQLNQSSGDIDMMRWMGRTALELIGQGGLGYSFDPLIEDKKNDFGDAMKNLFPVLFQFPIARFFAPIFVRIGSPAFRRRVVELIPDRLVQQLKTIIDTMDIRSREIYDAKKAALKAGEAAVVEQVAEGNDIMSILLKENMKASDDDKLPEEELIAQMSTLVFAATDTTTTALVQVLQLLSVHQDVQEKLRQEIRQARVAGEDLPYDVLVDLLYLDAVCRETLRLETPVTFVFREASEDVILPLSHPISGLNGELISEIPVPKHTSLLVGIRASNRATEIWGEDAQEWKPERWLSPLPDTVVNARIPGVYSNLMTFLGGGRACIGFKFSQLEMKVVLSLLLDSFKFSPAQNAEDIVWNFAAVKYPTVGKDTFNPSFPMKVEPLATSLV